MATRLQIAMQVMTLKHEDAPKIPISYEKVCRKLKIYKAIFTDEVKKEKDLYDKIFLITWNVINHKKAKEVYDFLKSNNVK